MSKYFNKYWLTITIVLSVAFALLFFPVAADRAGYMKAAVYTLVGLIVIWIVYFIRAWIFQKKT